MSPIEKLARDICWAEFAKKPAEYTKASYWKCLPPGGRAEYQVEAARFVWIVKRFKPLRILMMVDFK
jgi:hypothetical protein